jgi:uncharacterized membrane protein
MSQETKTSSFSVYCLVLLLILIMLLLGVRIAKSQTVPVPLQIYRDIGAMSQRIEEHQHRLDQHDQREQQQTERIEKLERTLERIDRVLTAVGDTIKKLLVGLISGIALMFIRMYVSTKQLKQHRQHIQQDITSTLSKFLGVDNPPIPNIAEYNNLLSKIASKPAVTVVEPVPTPTAAPLPHPLPIEDPPAGVAPKVNTSKG